MTVSPTTPSRSQQSVHVGYIDIDIDTLREVHPTNVSGLASQANTEGHDPAKKSLLKLVWLALLAKFALTRCR